MSQLLHPFLLGPPSTLPSLPSGSYFYTPPYWVLHLHPSLLLVPASTTLLSPPSFLGPAFHPPSWVLLYIPPSCVLPLHPLPPGSCFSPSWVLLYMIHPSLLGPASTPLPPGSCRYLLGPASAPPPSWVLLLHPALLGPASTPSSCALIHPLGPSSTLHTSG